MTHNATLARSVLLFRAFLDEQHDPDRFYSVLAQDSVRQLAEFVPLRGRSVLDVGGGPGYFADAFRAAGADLRRARPGRRRAVRARRAGPGHAARQRPGAAGAHRRSGRLLLVQCARTRSAPVADGRRDGAGDQARRDGVPLVHAVAVAVGRPRDGAVALPRRAPGPRPLPRAHRPRAQEPVRRVAVRGLGRGRAALGPQPARRRAGRRAAALPPVVGALGGRRPAGCARSCPGISCWCCASGAPEGPGPGVGNRLPGSNLPAVVDPCGAPASRWRAHSMQRRTIGLALLGIGAFSSPRRRSRAPVPVPRNSSCCRWTRTGSSVATGTGVDRVLPRRPHRAQQRDACAPAAT